MAMLETLVPDRALRESLTSKQIEDLVRLESSVATINSDVDCATSSSFVEVTIPLNATPRSGPNVPSAIGHPSHSLTGTPSVDVTDDAERPQPRQSPPLDFDCNSDG